VVARLDPNGVKRVIDAGCGSGKVTELLLERLPDATVLGIDSSQDMLTQAAGRLAPHLATGRVELVHADLTEPLEIAPVDAILSTATFHWITDHDALFANLAALLRPGGQLVAQCGGTGMFVSASGSVRRVGENWAGATKFATPAETIARLERLGFTEVDAWLEEPPEPERDYVRLNVVGRWPE
jgi:trans-aconitate 2-methyltransferase